MTQNITASAASAREAARNHDGKFGTQPLSEADVDLENPDRQDPYYGAIAVSAAVTMMPGFEQATAHKDGSITTKTIHGYELGLKQDSDGRWWSQPEVAGEQIDWDAPYGRDRHHGDTPQLALKRTAHTMHLKAEVTERLHRELGFFKKVKNTTPTVHSVTTLETEEDGFRCTIATLDDPQNPGTSTQLIAMQQRTETGEITRAVSKDNEVLDAVSCTAKLGARHGQILDALNGSGTTADASVYGDGTSALARYNDATSKLQDEAKEAGYTAFTSRRIDLSENAEQYSVPTVRFTSETTQHLGSVEIAGDTGQVQRYFQSRPVDEFPANARKFRQMEAYALERTEQAQEINRLAETGLLR